ncbi:MAG: class I SAM-dependent methyltransferase [Candidatus Bathyarchaeota archaeon]|nr:class I SAM-dependent methyltransferase [Candidatus Bathyarchaeota archaeon]
MKPLTQIGRRHRTDKVRHRSHSFLGMAYTDIYDYYLNHLRDSEFNLLEIGVKTGSSLRMWADYFLNATIVGIDIDPRTKKYQNYTSIKNGNRIKVHIGSQEDEQFLSSIIDQYKSFGVILDDGSHINYMTLKSFEVLNSCVTDFYIIEDLRNSYEDLTRHRIKTRWPGMKYNRELDPDNSKTRKDFDQTFLHLIKTMDYRQGSWTSFNFHAQMLIMEKNYSRLKIENKEDQL